VLGSVSVSTACSRVARLAARAERWRTALRSLAALLVADGVAAGAGAGSGAGSGEATAATGVGRAAARDGAGVLGWFATGLATSSFVR